MLPLKSQRKLLKYFPDNKSVLLLFGVSDGSEGGRAGLRSVPDPRTLGGPGEEIQTETEEGAGEG